MAAQSEFRLGEPFMLKVGEKATLGPLKVSLQSISGPTMKVGDKLKLISKPSVEVLVEKDRRSDVLIFNQDNETREFKDFSFTLTKASVDRVVLKVMWHPKK